MRGGRRCLKIKLIDFFSTLIAGKSEFEVKYGRISVDNWIAKYTGFELFPTDIAGLFLQVEK